MPRIKISREQLYEEVWSKPTIQLAKSFGLSDVGLAKLCKRYDIPRPPRGYWARIEAGQSPRKIPLPETDGQTEITILQTEDNFKASGLGIEVQDRVDDEKQEEAKITISENLRGAHPLVVAARDELAEAKRSKSGILYIPGDLSLDISVSKEQLRRTLLILDALLKALEQRGYPVTEGPQATIFEDRISFGIKEAITAEKEQSQEHDLSGPYEFGFNRFTSREYPNGKLTIFIDNADAFWASGCRKQWRDGKKQRLEDMLNRIVAGLVEVAAHKREHTEQMEQRRLAEQEAARQRQEIARQRALLKTQQDDERARVNELLDLADGLRKSREIRQLVEAIREANSGSDLKMEEWYNWALMHADRLDPTKDSPYSILDEKLPEEPRRW